LIDSHAHIEMCDDDADVVVAHAAANGVERILTVAIDEQVFAVALGIAGRNPNVFAALGRHPNAATGFSDQHAEAILEAARNPDVRAIGETGLDFFRDNAPPDDQRRAFRAQIEIAAELQLPLTIHARAAEREVLDILDQHGDGVPAVIMHCFSAPDLVERVIEAGHYCSFAGNVTYKNAADLRAAAARVPDNRLLVETDAPFLAPQQIRGKRNEPANVTMTAEVLAQVRDIRYDELDRLVTDNAQALFAW
jgi:TatD DNase family protein